MIPEISAAEIVAADTSKAAKQAKAAGLRKAYALFSMYGVLVVRGLYSVRRINAVRQQFLRDYANYLFDQDYDDALGVGDGRNMVSVRLDGEFGKPELFAPQGLVGVLANALSEDFVIGAMSVVVAVPGATQQQGHADHQRLFGDDELEARVPAYAVNVMTPLIDINQHNGATMLHPGSHLVARRKKCEVPSKLVTLQRGDSVLMDVRIWHAGQANSSDQVRPLLSTTYYRPWFRDCSNHGSQPELILPRENIQSLPRRYRNLFADFRFIRNVIE